MSGSGAEEKYFTAIAKKDRELSRGWEGWGEVVTQPPSPIPSSLTTPFPVMSLWPRLCNNIKTGSDKGCMWCRHLGNSGDFFFTMLNCLLVQMQQHPAQQLQGPIRTLYHDKLPCPGEQSVLSPRSTDAWGAFGQHLLYTNPPTVWRNRDERETGMGEGREKR